MNWYNWWKWTDRGNYFSKTNSYNMYFSLRYLVLCLFIQYQPPQGCLINTGGKWWKQFSQKAFSLKIISTEAAPTTSCIITKWRLQFWGREEGDDEAGGPAEGCGKPLPLFCFERHPVLLLSQTASFPPTQVMATVSVVHWSDLWISTDTEERPGHQDARREFW